jgi:hypothetical protein
MNVEKFIHKIMMLYLLKKLKMNLPNSQKYFDPIADNNRSLVENFIFDSGVSLEVLQFATDYY